MNAQVAFGHERFLGLVGIELAEYVEPFVTTQARAIPESAYDAIEPELDELDDEHTVYALELCMLLRPDAFADRVVPFLAHPDAAVCCTAYRLIKAIRPDRLPADLAEQVARTPRVDLFGPDLRSGGRTFVATNEHFVRDLVAGLDPEPSPDPFD